MSPLRHFQIPVLNYGRPQHMHGCHVSLSFSLKTIISHSPMAINQLFTNCKSPCFQFYNSEAYAMFHLLKRLCLLCFLLLSFQVSLWSCASHADLASCLLYHNIKNFTTLPYKEHDQPSSHDYFKILNFSIQNLRFAEPVIPKPIAIVLPGSLEQLQKSVACSRESSMEIRVRCGGHSYEGTSYVADDGTPFVIIDMMNLNHVWVDMETETAWVEGGATLGETYYAISQASNEYGFSAGSCPTVGVGGHIGGGGFGMLSRKYGLAADNVVDALLVDADQNLLDRETMGEDVFWAIRGGGGGLWGIIYAWKIQLLKVPQVVTSFTVSRTGTKSHVANLVHKWQYVAPNLEDDFYLSCFVGAGLPQAKTKGLSVTFNGFYLGPRASAISILHHAFPELGVTEEECIEMSWIQSIVFFSGLSDGASVSDLKNRYLQEKEYFKAKSDYVKNHVPLVGIETALDILEKEPKGYVILDAYGGKMHNISNDAIAFPHRRGNLFTIQYLIYWKEAEKEKSNDYVDWIRGFYDGMSPFVSSAPRAAYINYMDFDLGVRKRIRNYGDVEDGVESARDWGEKYFLSNYDRLVRVKTMVDPNNVFTNEQGIPPISLASPSFKAQSK